VTAEVFLSSLFLKIKITACVGLRKYGTSTTSTVVAVRIGSMYQVLRETYVVVVSLAAAPGGHVAVRIRMGIMLLAEYESTVFCTYVVRRGLFLVPTYHPGLLLSMYYR